MLIGRIQWGVVAERARYAKWQLQRGSGHAAE